MPKHHTTEFHIYTHTHAQANTHVLNNVVLINCKCTDISYTRMSNVFNEQIMSSMLFLGTDNIFSSEPNHSKLLAGGHITSP